MTTKLEYAPTLRLLLLLIAVGALYWPGLHGELVVDDLPNLAPFWDLADGAITWQQLVFDNDSGLLGRPVAMLSFVVDYFVGGGAFWQFKFTNLLLHLLCGFLLYHITRRIIRRIPTCSPQSADIFALLVAALWMTAPLLVSTVLYVVQRMAILSTVFSLAGLLAYVVGRERIDQRFWPGASLIGSTFLVALPAAVFSKENGLLLPLLTVVVETFWFRFQGTTQVRRLLIATYTMIFAGVAVAIAAKLLLDPAWLSRGYAGRGFDLTERLLTEGRALWDYIGQLLLPRGLSMGLFHDDYPISTTFLNPPTTAGAWCAWMVLMWGLWHWRADPRVRSIGFGVVFFLSGHAVESTIIPLEIYFEHRNYLPATGLLIGLVGAVAYTFEQLPNRGRLLPLLALLPVASAAATYQRIIVWQSAESMARVAAHSHSRSTRLQTGLISMYLRDGDLDKALEHIRILAELDGGWSAAHGLAVIEAHCRANRRLSDYEMGEATRVTYLAPGVYATERLSSLAELFDRGNCGAVEARRLSGFVLAIAEGRQRSWGWLRYFHLARLLHLSGQTREAIVLLDEADQMDPARLEAGLLKIRCLLDLGDLDGSAATLEILKQRKKRVLKYQADMLANLEAFISTKRAATEASLPSGER